MKSWLFVTLLLAGCISPVVPTPPEPIASDVDAAAKRAMQKYAIGLSESFRDAAQQRFDAADKANAALATANKNARVKAFGELDGILDDTIGGDKWDADKAAKLFAELSDAFGKAAK